MSESANNPHRTIVAFAAASAALTVAFGVTLAGFMGWLGPERAAAAPPQPKVIFVPVQPDAPPPIGSEPPGVSFASHDRGDGREHELGHGGEEHDDD